MSGQGDIKKLLIVKMSAVGDVVMTLPALAALKERYPEAEIDWLVEPAAAGLVEDLGSLNRVIVSPRRKMARLIKRGRAVSAGRLLRRFRKELRAVEYDVVVDLQGLVKSAGAVWLARGRRKVGFAKTREHTGWALTEKMPAYDIDRHAVLRYLDAAVYLGARWPEPLPEKYYRPSEKARLEARSLLDGPEPGGYLVLNPGAKWSTKRWPASHWLKLAELAADKWPFRLIVTGGPEDDEAGRAVAAALPGRVLNLCGRTSLPALAAIMEGSLAVVTADTGPMHLAAAVGAGGLALFGPTKPNRTGPFGGRFQIVQPALDCLGCLKKRCDRPCLESLSPEEVLARLGDYLAPQGGLL